MDNPLLSGNWIYRSFNNNPEMDVFGKGQLQFISITEPNFKAVLDFGSNMAMDLYGTIVNGIGISPQVLLITGTGREGTATAKWVYQYQGYVIPNWAEGVNQVPAIVGSVIRTIPHDGGNAGLVASFLAIKQG